MSTAEVALTSPSQVLTMLELSIKGHQETGQALEMVLETMKATANRVELAEVRIQKLADKIDNEIRLLESEIGELYQAVVDRSIQVAKSNCILDDDFKTTCGKIRRRIWSELKKRFAVSKYIHIRRKDFDDAMRFVRNFSLADYL